MTAFFTSIKRHLHSHSKSLRSVCEDGVGKTSSLRFFGVGCLQEQYQAQQASFCSPRSVPFTNATVRSGSEGATSSTIAVAEFETESARFALTAPVKRPESDEVAGGTVSSTSNATVAFELGVSATLVIGVVESIGPFESITDAATGSELGVPAINIGLCLSVSLSSTLLLF